MALHRTIHIRLVNSVLFLSSSLALPPTPLASAKIPLLFLPAARNARFASARLAFAINRSSDTSPNDPFYVEAQAEVEELIRQDQIRLGLRKDFEKPPSG
jgi:hypothetical protein